MSSSTASTSVSIEVPQCSSFDLPSCPGCWSSSSSQNECVLNISTKDCLIWTTAFRKRSSSRPPFKNFWPFSLQELFPHPCLHDQASKDTVLLFSLTSSPATLLGLGGVSESFSQHYLSVHALCLVCVSADGRGSMDWSLQDASDQFSFHMKHELLTTSRHTKPTNSPSFPSKFSPYFEKNIYVNK